MALISGKTDVLVAATAPVADEITQTVRLGPYGEQMVYQVEDYQNTLGLSGSRYQAMITASAEGTPSGQGMGIQTTISDTANIAFIIVNGASAGGKRIVMDYIQVRITVAGTTTTSSEWAFEIDPSNRYSSGGTSLTVANCTTDSTQGSVASQCRYASITAAAAGGSRKWLWKGLVRKAAAPVWIVNDTVNLNFGLIGELNAPAAMVVSSTDANGTTYSRGLPPAIIGPGGSGLLHIANVANASTAPSILVQAGWHEV